MSKKLYECSVSFTYDAENPQEAANEFLANLQNNPNWFIHVRDTETQTNFSVDTETGDVQED